MRTTMKNLYLFLWEATSSFLPLCPKNQLRNHNFLGKNASGASNRASNAQTLHIGFQIIMC